MLKRAAILCGVVILSAFGWVWTVPSYAGAPSGSKGASATSQLRYKPGELLVRFAPKLDGTRRTLAECNAILSAVNGGTVHHSHKLVPGLTLVKLPEGITVEEAAAKLNKTQGIMYAEPNGCLWLVSTFPNDPGFGVLWGMHNTGQMMCGGPSGTPDADIDAPEAWDIKTDASNIIVAVIDSGVDYTHPDLADNMWINPGEDYPPLGVVGPEDFNEVNDDGNFDPEGNPLIDDIYGYDFCTWNQERDSDPMDEYGHGTHIAGTIGAVGDNNEGVVGVCWNVKIMALKVASSDWHLWQDDAIAAINYAVEMGAKVTSNSWAALFMSSMKS